MSNKVKKTKGKPDEVDMHVGNRLRVRRSLLGLSQEKLADAMDLTFQQVQKYERGINRISAGRLYQISKILNVPVNYFYEHVKNDNGKKTPALGMSDTAQEGFDMSNDIPANKDVIKLIKSYQAIENEEMRQEVLRFAKSMSTLSKSNKP